MATLKAKIDTSQGQSGVSVETGEYLFLSAGGSELQGVRDVHLHYVSYSWNFHGAGDPRARDGLYLVHAWPEPGTYTVDLLVQLGCRKGDSSQLRQLSDTATMSVEVNGQSFSSKLSGKAKDTLDRSAIKEAKDRNDAYQTALEEFKSWKESVASRRKIGVVEVEQRIRLWRRIFDEIKRSGRVTGQPFPDELWQKVGVTQGSFTDDYEVNPESWFNFSSESANWRRRMGFGDWDPSGWSKKKTDKYIDDEEASDFLLFGRELLVKRSKVERAATDLVLWLKLGIGSDIENALSIPNPGKDLADELKTTFRNIVEPDKVGLKRDQAVINFQRSLASGPAFLPVPGNTFLAELGAERYEEQVRDLAAVLDRLHESKTGLDFLKNLFRDRKEPGTIDPLNVFSPHEFSTADKKLQRRGQNYISTSQDGTKTADVYSKGHLKYNTNNGAYHGKAEVVAESGEKLVACLLPGAMAYLAENPTDSTSRMDVTRFGVQVRSAYYTDYELSELDQKERQFVEKLPTNAGQQGPGNWGWTDTVDLVTTIVGSSADVDVKELLFGTGRGARPNYVPRIKAMVAAYETGIATYEVHNPAGSSQISYADLSELKAHTTDLIGLAIGSYREFSGFWKEKIGYAYALRMPEWKEELAKKVTGEMFGEFIEDVLFKFKKITPWMDCVAAVGEAVKAGIAVSKGDYDRAGGLSLAATGGSLMAAGGAITVTAEGGFISASVVDAGAIVFFWGSGGSVAIPGAALTAVGAVMVFTGAWVSYYEMDTDVGNWIEQTEFGTGWGAGNYSDYQSLEYGYKRDDAPVYTEQLRGYYEITPDFTFESAEINAGTLQYPDKFQLKLKFTSNATQGGVSVVKGGAIYLRPHVHIDDDTVSLPWLHKIGVGDWMESQQAPSSEDLRTAIFPNSLKRAHPAFQGTPSNRDAEIAKLRFGTWLNQNFLKSLPDVHQWKKETWESTQANYAMKVPLEVHGATFQNGDLTKLSMTIDTKFAPLLTGIVPEKLSPNQAGGSLKWQWPTTTMEAIYLPPPIVRKLEGLNVRGTPADVNMEFAVSGIETALRSFVPLREPSSGGYPGSKETPAVALQIYPDWRW